MNTIALRPFAAVKLLTFAVLALASGCHFEGVRGNGEIVTENRTVVNFTEVEANGAFDIHWASGPTALSIKTDENLLRYVEANVTGTKLHLRSRHSLRPTHGMRVTLSSSALDGARLTGACRLSAANVSGKGFYLDGTGATRVTVSGKVNELLASMTGASRLEAASLQTQTAELSISGAGRAEVAVSDTLKVAISGAGKVIYSGNPTIEKRISGAGSVKQRE
ncbi:MAG: DUF2807 domain-containing protein [Verrucomicrobiota bacterium]